MKGVVGDNAISSSSREFYLRINNPIDGARQEGDVFRGSDYKKPFKYHMRVLHKCADLPVWPTFWARTTAP